MTLRAIATLLLVLIVVSVLVLPVSAANITMVFDGKQVQARFFLSLHQNMTSFPKEAISLDASSDSSMSNAIVAALRAKGPSASFTSLAVDVKSSANWLNLTLLMNLAGIYERRGSVADLNMTWKGFHTKADLRAGNLSYNTAGSRYLRPVIAFYENASRFENSPNATVQAVTFFVNGSRSVAGIDQANLVGNFTVLDFRSLDTPVDQWNRTYSLTNNTTSWRYRPSAILNASLRVQEFNKTFTLISQFGYDAEVSVPGLAVAQGNVLRADVGSGFEEWIMMVVVVSSLVLAVAVQMTYRRRKKALKFARR